jgi:hypothetical protein
MADPTSDPVLDAAGKTVVLAFDLAGSQISNLPDELGKALQRSDVQSAIQLALSKFALAKQKSGTTAVSDKEAQQLLDDLVKKAGGKLSDEMLEQLKKTPEYKRLEASLESLEKAVKHTPMGAWLDKNKTTLYIVGAGLAIGGAAALYITKTGGPVINFPLSKLSGQSVQIFKIGGFTLNGKLLSFKPETREIGGGLVGTESWGKLKVSVELGVVATDTTVKQVEGKVVLKTKDIDLGLTGSGDPTKNTVNLGITFGIRPNGIGPITVGVSGVVQDGKLTGGKVQGDWKLDKNTTLSVQGSSDKGATQGVVLFSKSFW